MMPRWHHSDSSSERYQEVKSIKTFYAAHISRSQAKSMFGNWTIILSGLNVSLWKVYFSTKPVQAATYKSQVKNSFYTWIC